MQKSLPSALDLIKDSWSLFTTSWNELVKISIWFLYIGLAHFALAVLQKIAPTAETILFIPVFVAMIILEIWISVRLMRAVLAVDSGKKPDRSRAERALAWRLWLPLVLVGMLQGFIILGGIVLFILPGIFLFVAISFSQFCLIDQDLRGLKAISASYQLVKGRWFAVLWRMFATGFIFGLGVMIVVGVLLAILAALAGQSALRENVHPLVSGTFALFQSIVQAAVIPLFVIVHMKIYRALKQTRGIIS
ncbi:MAG: hypothetical protein AAB879_01640 [Patescibacteria group bacterium]